MELLKNKILSIKTLPLEVVLNGLLDWLSLLACITQNSSIIFFLILYIYMKILIVNKTKFQDNYKQNK